MSEEKCSLYKKMHKVMEEIKYLAKDGKIVFGSSNYKVLTESKVTSIVKDKLVEHGLVIFPVTQSISREGQMTTVNTTYKIVDIDTGEFEILASSGQGVDTQDKGVGKAMSYSFKYLFLRTFAIPSGEDPDQISSEELDRKQEEEKKPTVTYKPNPRDIKLGEKPAPVPPTTQAVKVTQPTTPTSYTEEQKAKMKKVKEIFHLKTDSALNKYVQYWSDNTRPDKSKPYIADYRDINPGNLDKFCDYILENGSKVVPF